MTMTASAVSPRPACRRRRDLTDVGSEGHERRSPVDIVFEVRTRHVDAGRRTCPNRRTVTKGAFPDGMPGPLRYGQGVIAPATHPPAARTMKALTGRAISGATPPAWTGRLDGPPRRPGRAGGGTAAGHAGPARRRDVDAGGRREPMAARPLRR